MMTRMGLRSWLGAACLAWAGLVFAAPSTATTVAGVMLPSRRPDNAAAEKRLEGLVTALTRELRATPAVSPRAAGRLVYLSPLYTAAARLTDAAHFDEAARAWDHLLDEGARAPHRLAEPAELVTAHIKRVQIALARGEMEKTTQLLARVCRYDPGFTLRPEERTPLLRAKLDETRRARGTVEALDAATLGQACHESDVTLVLRVLDVGESPQNIEVSRWDGCRRVAEARVPWSAPDTQILAALSPKTERLSTAPHTFRPGPLGLGLTGTLLTAASVALLVVADGRYRDLQQGCGKNLSCLPDDVATPRLEDAFGWSLLAVGGAALTSALVWWGIARKKEKR
jgi:hypothetical protein